MGKLLAFVSLVLTASLAGRSARADAEQIYLATTVTRGEAMIAKPYIVVTVGQSGEVQTGEGQNFVALAFEPRKTPTGTIKIIFGARLRAAVPPLRAVGEMSLGPHDLERVSFDIADTSWTIEATKVKKEWVEKKRRERDAK